jgi:deoxyadenosine/deoxycytidine kinase
MAALNYKLFSIEGNIGSGKSTLLENLKQHYKDNPNVLFLKEPVDEWEKIKDFEGNTMLKKFYADTEKYSFAFQMMAYISRLNILKQTLKTLDPNQHYVLISERSLYTDKEVFAKMLHDQDKIEDVCYQIYLTWFHSFSEDFIINRAIYVKTDPENCYERIHRRCRDGEEKIPLEYLKMCHKYHEAFLSNIHYDKLVLDGNIDIYENEHIVSTWLREIDNIM